MKIHAAKTILSVLLGFLTFLFLLVLIVIIAVRSVNISKIIVQTDISVLLEPININERMINDINDSAAPLGVEVSVSSIHNFLRSDSVADEAGKLAQRYIAAITDMDLNYYLTSDEIRNTVESISPDIYDAFGYELTNEDFDILETVLNDTINLEHYNVGYFLSEADINIMLPSAMLSPYTLTAVTILCVLLIFDIFLIYAHKIRYAFLVNGIALAAAGLTCIVVCIPNGLLFIFLRSVLSSSMAAAVMGALTGVTNVMLNYGITLTCVGILFLIVHIFSSVINRNILIGTGENSSANNSKIQRHLKRIGFAVNITGFVACISFTFLFLSTVPDVSAYQHVYNEQSAGTAFTDILTRLADEASIIAAASVPVYIPEPPSLEERLAAWVSVGDIIGFGGYDWRVLDVQPDKVLIIADKIIEDRAYHVTTMNMTWEQCELREYLNADFYNSFSSYHKPWILETNVINNDHPSVSQTPGGDDTQDYIFLLSHDELVLYFSDRKASINDDGEVSFYIDKTAAKAFHIDDSRNTYYDFADLGVRWWIRTPGAQPHCAVLVENDGGYLFAGGSVGEVNGIRPAMWICPPQG